MQPEDQDKLKEEKKAFNDYARFSGLAFQMMATIGVFTFIGYKIDGWLKLNYPVFTIIFVFLSVAISMYTIIRNVK